MPLPPTPEHDALIKKAQAAAKAKFIEMYPSHGSFSLPYCVEAASSVIMAAVLEEVNTKEDQPIYDGITGELRVMEKRPRTAPEIAARILRLAGRKG